MIIQVAEAKVASGLMGNPRAIATRFADQVTVRMPEGMREEIGKRAAENGRSANSEIVARLQATLDPPEQLDAATVRAIVQEELAKAIEILLSKR